MSAVGQTTWKAVKSHIPLIKFRKAINGQRIEKGLASGSSHSTTVVPRNPSTETRELGHQVNILSEFALSSKYSRKPPGELEIEIINNGGRL